jgi:hypothetical protein
VVEGARLESVCRGNSTVGSNPTLSAILLRSRLSAARATAEWRRRHDEIPPKPWRRRRVPVRSSRPALELVARRVAERRPSRVVATVLRKIGASTFLTTWPVSQRCAEHAGRSSATPHQPRQTGLDL